MSKFTKNQIIVFDWSTFKNVDFEVYGADHFLTDYGNNLCTETINDRVSPSCESEFFVSFSMPFSTSDDEVVSLLRILRKNHFYY
jgi:hypothetical protein